jgi:hypothetical protein
VRRALPLRPVRVVRRVDDERGRDVVERLREVAPPRRDPPRPRERGASGTFAPFSRASLRPIAIACLRLVTLRPLRPLRSVPRFARCTASRTDSCALRP